MKLAIRTVDDNKMSLTIQNDGGRVTAQLYIKPNGNLHDDSWIAPMGWMEKMPVFGEPPESGGDPMLAEETKDG